MIDIHSHILPGLDDGAQTESDSIALARAAVKEGISTIIATPHHKNGLYHNERDVIVKHVGYLNELLRSNDIPLEVLPGQETRINGDLLKDLKNGKIQTLNDTKYLFVELPFTTVPRYAESLLFDLQVEGYVPIIVHPERNQELLEKPDLLYEFVRNGSLTQITSGSLIGKFGKEVEQFSEEIIDANLAHFIASDAHDIKNRSFHLAEAYEKVSRTFGTNLQYTFMENSKLLIDNLNVNRYEPVKIDRRRKRFFGLF